MSQEKVCQALNAMDSKIRNMLTLIMQSSNVVETELVTLATNYLLGKKNKSPLYHESIDKYILPLIKLISIKDINKIHKILKQIELTRDASIYIVDKFLEKTANYEQLVNKLAKISYIFHETGEQAKQYNQLLQILTKIERNINATRETLYGAIRNVKLIRKQYYEIRNEIVLAYLKLNLGVVCKSTNKIEDGFQNGVIGIMHAIDKSRVGKLEDKIFSFANFVKYHIKNAINNTEFNIRTDTVFNISSQTLHTFNYEDQLKIKGEKFIDDIISANIFYIPYYLQTQPDDILNDTEQTILALLNGNPAECKFNQYPTKEDIKIEITRQKKVKRLKKKFL